MSSVARKEQVFVESANSTPYFIDTEKFEDPKLDWFEEHVKVLTRWEMPMLNLLEFHVQDEETTSEIS